MDTEQLKIVVDLINGLTGNTMTALLLYLGWLLLKLVLSWAGAITLVVLLLRGLKTYIRKDEWLPLEGYAEKFNTKSPGAFTDMEIRATKRKIRTILDQYYVDHPQG